MAESSSKVLEGVFAIQKPPSLSSAQVLRDLQHKFAESKTFAPLLEDGRRKQAEQERHQGKKRRRNNDQQFKMGHGGTLDPMATGVLIVGLGRGTKHLQNFLGCTKTYDTVVLFGKSTDTYDIAGKIVAEAPFEQINKEKVEANLGQFRGDIKQVPPVYSALKINGMKAYEYARSGKELPRELESREMQVDECELVEWYEGGQHDFRWPIEEAPEDEKAAVSRLIRGVARPSSTTQDTPSIEDQEKESKQDRTPMTTSFDTQVQQDKTSTSPSISTKDINSLPPSAKAALHTHIIDSSTLSSTPSPAPAARVRLTVSSGFYVRSFAHDLGLSLNSMGIMAELARSRQAEYTTADPAPQGLTTTLTYADFEQGEDVWGPKITATLERWMDQNPVENSSGRVDDRDQPREWQGGNHRNGGRGFGGGRGGGGRGNGRGRGGFDRGKSYRGDDYDYGQKRRKNSSSPDL